MDISQCAPGLQERLQKGGWFKGRKANIDDIKERLGQLGIVLSAAAEQFWTEFNGLEFEIPEGGIRHVEFSAPAALRWLDKAYLPKLEETFKTSLCPVGYGEGHLLLLTHDTQVFVLHDEWLGCARYPSVCSALEGVFGVGQPPFELVELPPLE